MTPATTIDSSVSGSVHHAVARVRARIATAAAAAGRSPNAIRLIGVTKTVDAAGARTLFDAGIADLGENRVAEGAAKAEAVGTGPIWHHIGHLQGNKVRRAVQAFDWIHGVDSLRLLEGLERVAGECGVRPRCLLQVNVAGETQKHGLAPDAVAHIAGRAAGLAHVRCVGLMTIAPLDDDAEASRPHFAALRTLRDHLVASTGLALPELSMGMSQDYAVAVEEGATLLRVGTALTASLGAPPGSA
jgi:PLP dependent protein